MQVLARARSLLARHPILYWGVAGAAGLSLTFNVTERIEALDHARRAWGETRTVWVATGALTPGEVIVSGRRNFPAAVVVAGAATTDPTGRVAVQRVDEGEVIMVNDIGTGPLDLLPIDWHGVAIARDELSVGAAPGDRVSVVAAGVVLVDEAVVIAVDDLSLTIGVPAVDAAAVANAAHDRAAVLTLRRP